jgi:hypothetical protein
MAVAHLLKRIERRRAASQEMKMLNPCFLKKSPIFILLIFTVVLSVGQSIAAQSSNDADPHPAKGQKNTKEDEKPDIRKLTQHFTNTSNDVSPWMFVPKDNIRSMSTAEHPGYLTIWHGDKGEDIKGMLKNPIKIGDYPTPWEFHLGLAQFRSSELPERSSFAIGVNIALTFSDPSTWPKDRTQLPPDTHTAQIFIVHLKAPQIHPSDLNYNDPGHEMYLVYGRGDLSPAINGNWKVPYIWEGPEAGAWSRTGGPASYALSFRVKVDSPTMLEVGFFGGLTGEPHVGWRMKPIDVSRFGKITGIWELGPIISLDGWMPNVLGPALGLSADPPLQHGDPSFQFDAIDYAAFFGANVENVDHMSDDFDIPGFQAKWYHESQGMEQDYSHPGYLTVTIPAPGLDGWAMCPTSIGSTLIDMTTFKNFPGYEVEMAFIPPPDETMWDLYMSSFTMWDEQGKPIGKGIGPVMDPGLWEPGVQYFPKTKKHEFFNVFTNDHEVSSDPYINVKFDPPVPESILAHKPLYMLAQILDASHMRFGFRAKKSDPWYLSKIFDTTTTFGKIGKFNPHVCITTTVGARGEKGWGIGNYPRYPQFLIDYVHFHYGLTAGQTDWAKAKK